MIKTTVTFTFVSNSQKENEIQKFIQDVSKCSYKMNISFCEVNIKKEVA